MKMAYRFDETAAKPGASTTITTMRAAVFSGPGRIRIVQAPLPRPGDGEVRVRVAGCGLCASNLGPWEGGPWYEYPLAPGAPGHEGWGSIDAVGPGADESRIGEQVAFLSGNAYAQFDRVAAASAIALPAAIAGRPFAGEPLACAMNVFRRTRIERHHTVAIVGIGFLGALLTQLCAGAGARVLAVSRRPYALETARRCGASACFASDDRGRVVAAVRELTNGRGCERVIEAVGRQEALDLAAELTGTRARLVIAGYHQDGPRRVDMQQWNWQGLDVINAHERDPEVYRQGVREAVAAVLSSRLDPGFLMTHEFSLEDLPQAFAALEQRPEGFLKAWINPW